MKYAADFRKIARDALRGRWGIAVIAGLIALLLGGTDSGGPEINIQIQDTQAMLEFEFAGQTIYSTGGGIHSPIGAFIAGAAVYFMVAAVIVGLLYLFLGGVVRIGYARFHLAMVDHGRVSVEQLFGYFSYWKTAVCTRVLKWLYTFLWSLVLVIPGIIASYSYSMAEFILAEHPEMTAREAIAASKAMMDGHKWRLFCLHMSFLGWDFLCLFTFGIGNLWLVPYKVTSRAAFYREISGTEQTM